MLDELRVDAVAPAPPTRRLELPGRGDPGVSQYGKAPERTLFQGRYRDIPGRLPGPLSAESGAGAALPRRIGRPGVGDFAPDQERGSDPQEKTRDETPSLNHVKYIITEGEAEPLYVGQATVHQVIEFLQTRGYRKVVGKSDDTKSHDNFLFIRD